MISPSSEEVAEKQQAAIKVGEAWGKSLRPQLAEDMAPDIDDGDEDTRL